jgi:diguanylate cyclase (GGDEF)-like protein
MKGKIILIIIGLIFALQSFSQDTHENLELNIDDYLIETEELRTKNFSQFSKNIETLNNSFSSFTAIQQCFFNYLKLYKQAYLGDFKSTIQELDLLKTSCPEIKTLSRIKSFLANLYAISGDYKNSLNELDELVSKIDLIKDKTTKHYAYSALMIVYQQLNQNELSLKFSNLLVNDNPSDVNKCRGLIHRYLALLKINDQNKYNNEINSVISNCENLNENILAQALNVVWIKNKLSEENADLNLILNELKTADIKIEKTNFQNLISYKNSLLAELYYKLNKPQMAQEYALKSVNNNQSMGDTEHKTSSLHTLIKIYEENGNFIKAFDYLKQKTEAERLHYDNQQAKIMAFQIVNHDNLAKTHQIIYLNNQNELLTLQNTLAEESKLNQKLIILSLLLGVALLALWGYKHKREQKIYRRLSELDHMTLIYNRKGMRDYMQYLLPYSEKKQELITYAIFDLDHFKSVNDQFGHVTGDWVIKNVILECQKVRNDNEQVTFGRLGGEEFAIIIRDSHLDEMIDFAEKCRQSIENIDTAESGFDFKITASFGITTSEKSGFIYTDIMSDADKALYQAKDNGRNQIVIFQP